MRLTHFTSLVALTMLLVAQSATAQRPNRKTPGQAASGQMRQSMQGQFDRSSPEIGAELPDVSGYRSDGSKISLRSLRGKYTVLVFGCLT